MTRVAADTVVIHARVWSPGDPPAEALAIHGGRIVAVGTDRDIADMRSPTTRVIDAVGRRVLPGLTDAHLHFVPGGLRMNRLDLSGTYDWEEAAARINQHAAVLKAGAWIEGGGWTSDAWSSPVLPNRRSLDAVSGHRPAFLFRLDCHAALVNSAALLIAGIDRHGPPDPAGGCIDRDAHGEPTGILRESAMNLVSRHVPLPSEAQRDEAVRAASRHALRHGLTMLHNMLDEADIAAVRRVRASGAPMPRLYHILHRRPDAAAIARWQELSDETGTFTGVPSSGYDIFGACKNYMDGSLGSRTAWMLEPYAEGASPQSPRGMEVDSAAGNAALLDELCIADRAGLQLCAHAIGDAANRALLDLYEQVARRNGSRDRRPRVEHAQHIDDADLPRFAALGAIASMQPLHKRDDGGYAERALGRSRLKTSYRFADLLNVGATLAFGSDWPIADINPFAGIHAAVTGRTRSGDVWLERQSISVEEALTAYTAGAARAGFAERRVGRIAPGMAADIVMTDRDPFDIDPDALCDVRMAATMLGGQVVYSAL